VLKGFKEFIVRGNVIDLAVAVVIGAAFTAIVNALVSGIFNPIIAIIFNADAIATVGITLREASGDQEAIVLAWGLVLSALIQFLLVAAVIYFGVVLPMNIFRRRAEARAAAGEPAVAEDVPPTEQELLTEIRDLLKAQSSS
tara:strand:+ start:51428 stop:51853 length:426 start_codon:yes stop_codon:yes gene_type:complete